MKKLAEVMANMCSVVVSTTLTLAIVVAAVIFFSRHVTCLNLFDKVCFVW